MNVAKAYPSTDKMFEERAELTYFMSADKAPAFIEQVGRQLEVHAFHWSESEEPPPHYVTTLYFDSDTREIVRACESGHESVRLRAREYYDRDPELGILREPLLWLEVKTRAGASTRKARFAIPSDEIRSFLTDGSITRGMIMLQRPVWGESAEAVLNEVADLCNHTVGPLKPDCLAHYRRRAWQDAEETIRVTLDTELAFHRPPANLFQSGMTLSEALVTPPVAQPPFCLVEVKLRGPMPDWLGQLIRDIGLEPALDGLQAFSKFVAASHAVHP